MEKILVYLVPVLSLAVVSCVVIASHATKQRNLLQSVKRLSQPSWIGWGFMYGRRVVYGLAIVWAWYQYYQVTYTLPTAKFALSSLMRSYGLTGIFLLFIVLTPGLIVTFFPRFSLNGLLVHLRRSLGVSVFFFGFLHGTIGFFNNLSGNINALAFLSSRQQLALLASSTAFIIYSLLALTSFDGMVQRLGRRWKILHRFVYLAAILTVFHAFMIGSHYTTPTQSIPLLTNFFALTFILFEVIATLKRSMQNQTIFPLTRKIVTQYTTAILVIILAFYFSNYGLTQKYDPHARHRKGYSKNYTLNVKTNPEQIMPGQPVELTFSVTDKRNGRLLKKYQISQTKLMHVIVLRHDLTFYDHIHPEYNNDGLFTIKTTFPSEGKYNLYVDYSPPDFYENLSIGTIQTAQAPVKQIAELTPDTTMTKTFENRYKITLTPSGPYTVNDTIDITYTLEDTTTNKPITDLETYLGAFGHVASVSEDLSVFTHVHPLNPPLSPSDPGGPQVRFSTFFPKPGKYKFFTQFKHNGKVFVTDFTVEAK